MTDRNSGAPVLAAVVQAAPHYLDLDRSVDKAVSLIGQAAAMGAGIVAFPELWLPGYPWWIWLAPPAWAAQRGLDLRYREQAFRHGSPQAERIAQAARDHRIVVVMGLAENEGGSLYVGQWVVDEQGRTRMRRRKLKPGAIERSVFGEGGAGDLAVCDTGVGRVGALCCGEHRHPLFKQALHSQGETLHVAAWPSFSVYQPFACGLSADTNMAITRTYAAEGGCYVLAPSAPVTPEMRELLCDTDEKRALLGAGGGHAQIFGPEGDALCTPLAPDAEGILIAPIDPARIVSAKAAYDVTGHSARPDIVQLRWTAQGAQEPAPAVPGSTVRPEAATKGRGSKTAPVDVTQNLTYRLLVLNNTLGRSAARRFSEGAGLSMPEWRVLSVIGSRDQITFNALAQTLDVDKGWVSRTLAQMEANGLVLRLADPADGRQFRLSLTPAGHELHLKGSDISIARQKRLESPFTPSELDTLYTLLARLQQAADDLL